MFYQQSIIDILLEECLMYLRKSRSDDPSLTVQEVLRNHEKELDEWCEKYLGGKIPEENRYREIVSGEKMDERPELQKVLGKIENPKIKYIVCVEPTRLSRGYLDEIGKLIKLLRYNKITVITPSKIYNLDDEYDREAFERELKRGNEYLEYAKKTMYRGKMRKCIDGEWIFNSAPYGYNKIQYKEGRRTIKTLTIDEEKAEVVRMIFNWYAYENISFGAIAERLNEMKIPSPTGGIWTRNTNVSSMLLNHAYIGKIRFQYRKRVTEVVNQEFVIKHARQKDGEFLLFDGLHDAIISEELFYDVQERKKLAVPVTKKTDLVNMFAGLVTCKKCGHVIKLQMLKGEPRYMLCRHMPYCESSAVPYQEFVNVVCNVLKQSIEDFEIKLKIDSSAEIEEHKKLLQLTEKKLKKLEQTEIAQWESQMNPDVSQRMPQHIFKSLNEKVVADISETKELLQKLYSTAPTKVNYEPRIATFKKALEYIHDDSVPVELKNDFLKGFIEKIYMSRDKRRIIKKKEAEALGIPYENGKTNYENTPFHIEITFKE